MQRARRTCPRTSRLEVSHEHAALDIRLLMSVVTDSGKYHIPTSNAQQSPMPFQGYVMCSAIPHRPAMPNATDAVASQHRHLPVTDIGRCSVRLQQRE